MSNILWWIGWSVMSLGYMAVIFALLLYLWLAREQRHGRNPFL